MLDAFSVVSQNVLILLLLMLVGLFLGKSKLVSEEAAKGCANIALYIATPCVIIKSCIREFDTAMMKGFLIVAAAAIVQHLLLIAASRLFFRREEDGRRRVLRFAMVLSNAGFMGIPLQQAILGEEGVFYCAAYVIVFNIVLWTYGIMEMSGGRNAMSLKKLVINPGIIGVAIGLCIFLLAIPIPVPLQTGIGYLASLNTPLPMLVIGYYLGKTDLKAALRDGSGHLCMFLRLLGAPLVALGLLLLCGVRDTVLISLMICISTPTATACTMFASRFDRQPLLSVNIVSISTLLSVITIPMIITLTSYLSQVL